MLVEAYHLRSPRGTPLLTCVCVMCAYVCVRAYVCVFVSVREKGGGGGGGGG
eukprot:COSAG03_NODE_1511_length_3952_cov_10.484817_1_plen_51_part_10